MKTIEPKNVINELKKHILVDGFHIVADLDQSKGSYLKDAATGHAYLDCYSQFASQPLGWNHPALINGINRFGKALLHKMANSDMYTVEYAQFVDMFASITSDFKHYFFIDGGALAIENALKAAFDWKAKKMGNTLDDEAELNVVHLTKAFHGRTGYTMSLTNTGSLKTGLYPKFNWTRLTLPLDEESEKQALAQAEEACAKGNVAAIITEPILGEGGDIHLSTVFLSELRKLANKHDAMLIFDEVQTGMGLTGRWWAHQHHNVIPDMMCFGKKTQVCGFCSTGRIDEVENNVFTQSGRINSTWGGNIVDMIRASIIIEAIRDNKLCENAATVGAAFKEKLKKLQGTDIQNIRGLGLMIAFDLPTVERRDEVYNELLDQRWNYQQFTFERLLAPRVLALKCGDKGIRFRPHLTFSMEDVGKVVLKLKYAAAMKKKAWWKWK